MVVQLSTMEILKLEHLDFGCNYNFISDLYNYNLAVGFLPADERVMRQGIVQLYDFDISEINQLVYADFRYDLGSKVLRFRFTKEFSELGIYRQRSVVYSLLYRAKEYAGNRYYLDIDRSVGSDISHAISDFFVVYSISTPEDFTSFLEIQYNSQYSTF